MKIINANCAGIDAGSRSHFVAIGQDLDDVKEFGLNEILYDSKDVLEMAMIDGIIRIQYDPITAVDPFGIKTFTIDIFNGKELT